MRTIRRGLFTAALVAVVLGCGDPSSGEIGTDLGTDTIAAPPEQPVDTATATGEAPAGPPAQPVLSEQPAVWPAADVVFATPEEAATDFVQSVFGVTPVLGEFRAGDQRSGELDVLFAGEEVAEPQIRSGLLLRRLGPDDGWFILGGGIDAVTIDTPEAYSDAARGPLTVEGTARGFEGTVLVSAFPAGDAGTTIDEVIARGGALEASEPYSATIDVSTAPSGVIAVLVRGDTGADDDTGEFAVIPVTIVDMLPALR